MNRSRYKKIKPSDTDILHILFSLHSSTKYQEQFACSRAKTWGIGLCICKVRCSYFHLYMLNVLVHIFIVESFFTI